MEWNHQSNVMTTPHHTTPHQHYIFVFLYFCIEWNHNRMEWNGMKQHFNSNSFYFILKN